LTVAGFIPGEGFGSLASFRYTGLGALSNRSYQHLPPSDQGFYTQANTPYVAHKCTDEKRECADHYHRMFEFSTLPKLLQGIPNRITDLRRGASEDSASEWILQTTLEKAGGNLLGAYVPTRYPTPKLLWTWIALRNPTIPPSKWQDSNPASGKLYVGGQNHANDSGNRPAVFPQHLFAPRIGLGGPNSNGKTSVRRWVCFMTN